MSEVCAVRTGSNNTRGFGPQGRVGVVSAALAAKRLRRNDRARLVIDEPSSASSTVRIVIALLKKFVNRVLCTDELTRRLSENPRPRRVQSAPRTRL